MKIYTKSGDKGETSLFGGGRVSKNNLRIKAYGTVDELNSILGLAASFTDDKKLAEEIKNLQNQLFILGSDLATPLDKNKVKIQRVSDMEITFLESRIDFYDEKLPELRNFILPGGSNSASYLHFARTVCRRAEREIVALAEKEEIGIDVVKYINRLSDLLFMLARFANIVSGTSEIEWKP
jgi:cob(I)alamin adenosyltransferase